MGQSYSTENYSYTSRYEMEYSLSYHDNSPRTYFDQSPFWYQYDILPPCREDEELSSTEFCKLSAQ